MRQGARGKRRAPRPAPHGSRAPHSPTTSPHEPLYPSADLPRECNSDRSRRRRVGCGSPWPPGLGRGTHSPSGVDPRGAPRRMTRFWVKTWVEPGGGRRNNTTNRCSLWRVLHIQIKRPAGFISGFSGAHDRRGRQTVLMPKPAACCIPELFTCAKPPRQARKTTSRGMLASRPRRGRPEGCAAISRALRPRPGSGSYATIGSILRACSGSATSPMS